ncbi:MAG TPA: glutathione S-transferase family protein [Casimicrobiaceae bacterium]|nr:glutathione S-transferase family protein [Casimicrobiaceae bacterium]
MLKIWGRISSINVQKVVACAQELGLRFERVDAGGKFGVVDTDAYAKLNPNRLVPTIEDGDFVLWESNAIVRYLARVHGSGSLWPSDAKAGADADRWMEWQSTTVNPALFGAFWNLIRTEPDKRDQAAIEASMSKLEQQMTIFDAHLAGKRWVTGDTFTMGDIPIACSVHRWFGLPCEHQARPNVQRWLAQIHERPAFKGVLTLPVV